MNDDDDGCFRYNIPRKARMFGKTVNRTCVSTLRRYSTAATEKLQRPPLREIFPKKKFINRQLFDLDSRLTYRKLLPIYEKVYRGIDEGETPENDISSLVDGSDLLIMKKALEKYRIYSNTINRNLVQLENQLVEKAAEHGNNDAIALLAFETLTTMDQTILNEGDKPYAKELIKNLYLLNHPLSIKLLGDLSLKYQQFKHAKQYYLEFLELESDTVLSGEVYKQLGMLCFTQEANLHDAKLYFLQSIKFAPLDKTLESHYFLGEIYLATDPELAKYHLQLAASKSFRQAFKSLGFLELNYFNNFVNSREWFKMGVEVQDYDCLIGLFDTFYKFGKRKEAIKTLKSIRNVFNEKNKNQEVFTGFLESRGNEIKDLIGKDDTN
ncbi:Mss2 protein [Saccharomycopsis crataegensis]|uniref:Mss2 protein n=1 Tax=Saccharomycopsis crataegensis TaxID=43959 RepID=A0AAV5QJQ2_9ASCO|nr:Mss2 protein [Saccharomycopsis crataegensis]